MRFLRDEFGTPIWSDGDHFPEDVGLQMLAGWCFKGDVNVPGPSAEEKALQRQQTQLLETQTDILKEQIRQQELLAPFLYREAGVEPTYDEEGKITGFQEINSEAADLRDELEIGLLERARSALAGELPIDHSLVMELDKQERVLREGLRKSLGEGFETSDPGIRALGDFNERKAALIDASARGELSLSQQLQQAQGGFNQNATVQQIQNLFGIARKEGPQLQGFQSVFNQGTQLQGIMQNERNMQLNASIANAQSGGGFPIGDILGAGAGLAGALFS